MNLAISNFNRIKTGVFIIIVLAIKAQSTLAQDSIPIYEGIFSMLQSEEPNQGSIGLYQDVLLYELIADHIELNERNGLDGYRIQINQWSGQNSREKALSKSAVFKEKFPEFDESLVYVPYEAPYYKLRVGDFRNRNAAFEFYNQVRRYFPNSYIVKTKIEFPKLDTVNDSTENY